MPSGTVRVCRQEPRIGICSIDDPKRANAGITVIRTGEATANLVLGAPVASGDLHHSMKRWMLLEGASQFQPVLGRKSKRNRRNPTCPGSRHERHRGDNVEFLQLAPSQNGHSVNTARSFLDGSGFYRRHRVKRPYKFYFVCLLLGINVHNSPD
jgi:hypothetical protein